MLKQRTLTRYSLLLIAAGLIINFACVKLALYFELPVFLDSIGTVLAAALGGYLPGMVVGFFSNVINGISDPITMYYGIVSILIAAAASFLSGSRVFASLWKTLISVPLFAVIGGALGSLLTFMLYGFGFGTGISAPLAHRLCDTLGLSVFMAQFSADLIIDILDKLVTLLIVFGVLRLLPLKLCRRFPLGECCKKLPASDSNLNMRPYRLRSLRSEVVTIIVGTALILGTLATAISFAVYKDTMIARYTETAESATRLMCHVIDADRVQEYLDTGGADDDYAKTEAHLEAVKASMPDITYMYVYQILEDGCHVVFDLDTEELKGEEPGSLVEHDDSFLPYREALLVGDEIEPVISNDTYGWLLTVYRPMRDHTGRCVAYAAADIAMTDVVADRYVFIIRIAALLFGASIIIVMFTVWFAERRIVEPINAMAEAAGRFAYENEDERLQSVELMQDIKIKTGDELENLYQALDKTVTDVAEYITDINEKNAIITRMQSGIIMSFADMVESRDLNTGEHVRHTAEYVRITARALKARGAYEEELTDAYIETLERSAPLHDIGKIKISDTLLNKPGRLSAEEFEIMKTHTVSGREILKRAAENSGDPEYLATAEEMAAYHHERWDGAGYPEGLKGEAIPLCARIMAVADVFDALVSRRSYKSAMDTETALKVIREESGAHFDPEVVEAFLDAYSGREKRRC